jgi:hypothetical protein
LNHSTAQEEGMRHDSGAKNTATLVETKKQISRMLLSISL